MGKFEIWEPKNLWYTTSTFILFDYFPKEPVHSVKAYGGTANGALDPWVLFLFKCHLFLF